MMAPDLLLTVLAAAGLAGPLSCTWPAKGEALMRRLNAVKVYRRAGAVRTVAGGVLVAALLGAGALAAYAAEPSGPEQLPRAVVGVVGSGDRLSLTLKEAGDAPRTLKVGDEYKDGWRLKAVTATTATLAKGGVVRLVGLNPAGAIRALGEAAPSEVTVVGEGCGAVKTSAALDQATVDQLYDTPRLGPLGRPLPNLNQPGLSAAENRRWTAYGQLIRVGAQPCWASGIPSPGADRMLAGEAYDDWRALEVKRLDNLPPVAGVTRHVMMSVVGQPARDSLTIQIDNGMTMGLEDGTDPMQMARESHIVTILDGVPVQPLYPPTRAELAARGSS